MKTNLLKENSIVNEIVKKLEDNYEVILKEYKENTSSSIYLDYELWFKCTGKFPPYLGLYILYLMFTYKVGKYDWETVSKRKFPKTHDILKSFNLIESSFAKLGGRNRNVLHTDSKPEKPMIRIHLPLIVPKGNIFFVINGEKIKWEKGKCISFDTSIPHKFWNLTGRDRINLLVSLWK